MDLMVQKYRQKIMVEFDRKRSCLKESGVTALGRKEVEVGTLLLGNDKNNVIVNYLLSYLSKGLSKVKDK